MEKGRLVLLRRFIVALMLLAACSTETYREGVRKDVNLQSALKVGMTPQELKAAGVELSNCRGRPEQPSSCEVSFERGHHPVATGVSEVAADSMVINQPTEMRPTSKSNPAQYTLFFKDGKLQNWSPTSN